MKRIALIGSAPSSVRLAPYNDPSWEVWGCSPGAYPHISPTRANAYFELHRWEPPWGYTGPKNWFTKDYCAFLASLKCPVYMIEHTPDVPASVAYPKQKMLDKYGPFFFTSSLSWMFALAIESGATEIGLWGVDMSAQEEWQWQRQGCQYFISVARAMGIKVTIPPESDLLRPPPLYGFCEVDPMHVKLLQRRDELRTRIADAEQRMTQARDEWLFLKGAADDNEYQMKTWIGDHAAVQMAYQDPAVEPNLMLAQTEAPEVAPKAASRKKPNGNGAHIGA